MAKALKSALHHWWPRSLSQFWIGSEGQTNQLSWDGTVVRSPPANFGAIKNAHHIKFKESGTVWDTSFESAFDVADNLFPALVEWLLTLESKHAEVNASLQERLLAQPLSQEQRKQLAHCLASLIVRSPFSRNNIKTATEYFRKRFGFEDYEADKMLIAANMRGCYETFQRAICNGGKFGLLFSDSKEFIFGDGFLHNFPSQADHPMNPRCVIPLTPAMTIVFTKPPSYRREPELVTMRLGQDEVEFLNDTVQIYSRDCVFYANDKPRLIAAFSDRKFYQYEYHKHEWLEQLIGSITELIVR